MKNNLIKERILEIFTFSTALEVTFYNEEGKFINSTLKDSTFNLLNNLNFNIKTFPLKKLNPNLNIKDYLSKSEIKYIPINNSPFEFAVIYINSCKGFNNYFLIGPYNSKKEIKLEDSLYNYRPRDCIHYGIYTLIKIIEDNKDFMPKKDSEFLSLNTRKAIEYIHKNYEKDITIDLLADLLKVNKCYFCSSFKKETGITFTNFLCKFRIEKSKELLKNPSLSLLDIAIAVGFNNQSYYSMVFKKHMDMTPFEYKKSGLATLPSGNLIVS